MHRILHLKTLVSYMIIPYLWRGKREDDEYYFYYSHFIWGSTILYVLYFLASGVMRHERTNKEYISPHKQGDFIRYYYILKFSKFAAFQKFLLNLGPMIVLMNGRQNLVKYLLHQLSMMGLLFIEYQSETIDSTSHIIYATSNILINMIAYTSITYRVEQQPCLYIISLGHMKRYQQVLLAFIKANSTNFLSFLNFSIYTFQRDNPIQTKRMLKRALKYDKHFQKREEIAKQVYVSDIMFKMGSFFFAQGRLTNLIGRTIMQSDELPIHQMPIFMGMIFQQLMIIISFFV
ncbi:hypothetical protein FGO68_gene17298 [Halteria grandinella]|uniref:Uncharacterized protein n=1 Tax=Halteria grandinella TaxID=5974 RepID=A0A8J8NYF1_HALGN|nr:hypothetical protein FGO68_gene17298 [Halteria grandinella]